MALRFVPVAVLALVPYTGGVTQSFADDLPFVGEWDCGVATFTFTADTYNNGTEDMPIQEAQEGTDGSYTLFFADDYTITLSGFTGEEMGWLSSSGESLECKRKG